MATFAAGSIDIDKPGKYQVVLSDALLGKASNDVYTGIRYNHKPDPSDSSSTSLHLQPSDDPTTYDLSFKDNSDKYQYVGSRTTGNGQCVLVFDPVKKHFVLHRLDSTFDMNLVSAPWAQDPETLKSQYPQLEPQPKTQAQPLQRKASKSAKSAATAKNAAKRQKAEKSKKKPIREPTPEAEDEDSDDGLTIEYPEGTSSQPYKNQSTPVFQRTVSEPSDEDEDAEGEYEDERNQDVDHLKLPSPANNNGGGLSDEELELDLEAELERALDETTGNNGGESSESEEE